MAVVDPGLGDDGVGKRLHPVAWSTQDDGLEAMIVAQVYVHGRDREIVMLMMGASQARSEFALVMVVDIAQGRNAIAFRLAGELLGMEPVADQVADGLGAVAITAPVHVALEGVGQGVV